MAQLIHPPLTPEQFTEPRWARFLFASQAAAWLWLVIRLYLAYIFIPAGWHVPPVFASVTIASAAGVPSSVVE